MKFILHMGPAVPATMEERERLRPIAHRTDKIQQMLDEMVEVAQLAEETGFDILTYSEHHFYPNIPTTIEPMIDAGVGFVGTVDDVRRQLAAVQQQLNPEYFLVFCDQGFLPLDEVKRQIELFAKLMPEFRTSSAYA